MALPLGFESYNNYFLTALSFLKEHECLFNFANTDILLDDILKNVYRKWQEHIDFLEDDKKNEVKIRPSICNTSKDYENFYENLQQLLPSVVSFEYDNSASVKQKPLNGLSPKKQHEIFNLSELIHEHCRRKNITFIVDLGSGLGYLSQIMYEKYGYSVLGIEADEIRLSSALKRQEKYHKSSMINVKYVRHFVTAQSESTLMELVKENFDKCERFSLVGLHACADLAVNAIKLFLQIKECESLIIMPCCYHKMAYEDNEFSQENCITQCQTNAYSNQNNTAILSLKNMSCKYPIQETNHKFVQTQLSDKCISKNSEINKVFDSNEEQSEVIERKISADPGDKNEFLFKNIPLSQSLKSCCRMLDATMLLQRPFLRLACQRVQAGWKDEHDVNNDTRVFHLMSRAVLQLYASKENAKLVKIKRRAVRKIQSKKCDFESFLDDAINRGYILELNSKQKHTYIYLNNKTDENVSNSLTDDSEVVSYSAINTKNDEYCIQNSACGNCNDSIAENKNSILRHKPEEQKQKNEQSESIQQEDATEGNANKACSMLENVDSYKHENASIDNNIFLQFDKNKILRLWNSLSDTDFKAANLLLDLQDSLQALCENLVLLDKIAFLHECNEKNGHLHFEFLKVTNDSLSPRCHALVASKQ